MAISSEKQQMFCLIMGVCNGEVEPSIKEYSLKYERKYYKVREGRAAITEDKVSDENARLLTMVAVAKELKAEEVQKADIILVVGLPFSDYGREKKALINYYREQPVMKYEFEGIRYDIAIRKVYVHPQCYSAIAPRLYKMKGIILLLILGVNNRRIVWQEKCGD